MKKALTSEFLLAVKIGLPNYFDLDSETLTITPKRKSLADKDSRSEK